MVLLGCSSRDDAGAQANALHIDGGVPPFGQCGTINSNIGTRFIEIERGINASSGSPFTTCRGQAITSNVGYNANLYTVKLDEPPADGPPLDFDNCAPGPGAPATDYIDWANLSPSQHTCDDVTNDVTAFSGDCVTSGAAPKKGDITGTAFASNSQFLYLGLTRKDNNGDVAFTYVFTKTPSFAKECTCGGPTCATGYMPTYLLQANDIVIRGLYPQSSGSIPVIDAYKYKGPTLTTAHALTASQLVQNLANAPANWDQVSSTGGAGGITAAANVDPTRATNVLPTASVGQTTIGGNTFLIPEIALELAVPMNVLVPNFNACDAGTFSVDVITQSSSSDTSALQDFIGRITLNLGSISATPTVTTACDGAGTKVDYSVGPIVGRNGTTQSPDATTGEFADYKCDWSCTSPGKTTQTITNDCKGSLTGLDAGSWTCTVTVTEKAGELCSKSAAAPAVVVAAPIAVTPALNGGCSKTFGYAAVPTGGSGDLTCAWTFSGATLSSTSSTSCSGGPITVNQTIASGGVTITGELTVTDARGCTYKPTNPTTKVYQEAAIQISPSTAGLTCPTLSTENDEIMFTAVVTGGSVASPSPSWTGCAPDSDPLKCKYDFGLVSAYCSTAGVYASVTDQVCGNRTSATYNVGKTTSISAVVAP